MMMKASLITTAVGLALTTTAVADFTGFDGDVSEYEIYTVIDVYAYFDDPGNAVLNVYGAEISTSDGMGFHHNDLADASGGSWKPSFSFSIPGAYDPMKDSFVTIGYGVGAAAATNGTALDPSFGNGLGAYVPLDAGWYNGNPDDAQYAADGRVHVGRFVFETSRVEAAGAIGFFEFDAEIGYNNGPGSGETFFGADNYTWDVPAPGALALLGIGGLVARRRRA